MNGVTCCELCFHQFFAFLPLFSLSIVLGMTINYIQWQSYSKRMAAIGSRLDLAWGEWSDPFIATTPRSALARSRVT